MLKVSIHRNDDLAARKVESGFEAGGLPEVLSKPNHGDARVVDTLDDATALSLATGDMFVTTDGDWVSGGQFVNAGNGRALEEGAGLLTFKRELRELESRINNLSAELAVAEVAVADARSRLTGLEESVVLLNASIAESFKPRMSK